MKKRIISMILVLAMVFSMLPAIDITASAETSWYTSGDGTTAEKAYVISTYDGLIAFAGVVNAGDTMEGKFVKLADNFGQGDGEAEDITTPIGIENLPFKGTFDGNGQTVVLKIGTEAAPYWCDYTGLFGYVEDGTVKNVTTSGAIFSSEQQVGGVVGWNYGGNITNCSATCAVSGESTVGGVVGDNSDGTVTNCYATCAVSGENYVGGVVGQNVAGAVTNCYATGTVSGIDQFGGVVGENAEGGTVTNCYGKQSPLIGEGEGTDCYQIGADMKVNSAFLVDALNTYLIGNYTANAKLWKVESGVNGGYPVFMDVAYAGADYKETEHPFIISTYDGLNDFAQLVNAGNTMEGKYIELADDFGKGDGTAEALTTPIGTSDTKYFKGTFDGNGQTVVLAIGSQTTPCSHTARSSCSLRWTRTRITPGRFPHPSASVRAKLWPTLGVTTATG